MVRYISVWNPNKGRMEKKKTFPKPKGFKNFTDYSKKNVREFKKEGYIVKKGRDPYSGRGGVVLFYKKKR